MSQKIFLYANLFLNDRHSQEINERPLIAHLEKRLNEGMVIFVGNTFNLDDRSFFGDNAIKKFQRISQAYPNLTNFLSDNKKRILFIKGKYDHDLPYFVTQERVQIKTKDQLLWIENGYKGEKIKADLVCLANSFESYINENIVHIGTIKPFYDGDLLDETTIIFDSVWKVKQEKVKLKIPNRGFHSFFQSDPVKAWDFYKELVNSAKESIYISTWFIYQSDIIIELVDLLKKKDKEGVEIFIICYDGYPSQLMGLVNGIVGQNSKPYKFDSDFKNLTYVSYAKGKFNGMHSKLLIVDSKNIILSDRNLMNDYYGPKTTYIGLDIYISDDKIASDMIDYIVKINTGEEIKESKEFVYADPIKKINEIVPAYVNLIKDAELVFIVNPILELPEEIIEALNKTPASRSNNITFITNYYDYISEDKGLLVTRLISYESCSQVKGSKLYGLNNKKIMHHKYMIVKYSKSYTLIFGSYNFDLFSERINSECALVIDNDDTMIFKLLDYSKKLIEECKEIKPSSFCQCL